jgi:predicted lipid-binding transport protein (Tim44 family)
MGDYTLDNLVRVYRALREAIESKTRAHEAEINELKAQQQVIHDEMLAFCNDQNLDSVRTKYGTVSRRIQTRYWTNDWDSMYRFVKENDAFQLLERRISNNNMKQFLDENPDAMPMGLQIDNKYIVQVRKPTGKGE